MLRSRITGWAKNQHWTDCSAPLTDLLIDAADLSGSERVGDIGCGTGATALQFAPKVGLTGHVTGIDISKKTDC